MKRILPLAAVALSATTGLKAQLYWDANGATVGSGNAGGDWTTDSKWSTDPTGSSATAAWTSNSAANFSAGTDGTGTINITASSPVTYSTIVTDEGMVNVTSGSLTSTVGNVNIMNGSTFGLTGSTALVAANAVASVDTGTFNVSGTATAQIARLDVGTLTNGTGTVNLSGGTLQLTGNGGSGGMRLAYSSGSTGTFNHTGGTLNSSATDISVGFDGSATYNASGTAIVNAGLLQVQQNGTLNVSGNASVTSSFLNIGTNKLNGNVVQTGGTVNLTGAAGSGDMRLGHWAAGGGSTYTMTGGVLNGATTVYVGWDGTNNTFSIAGTAQANLNKLTVQNDSFFLASGNSVTTVTGETVIGSTRGDNAGPAIPTLQIDANAVFHAIGNVAFGNSASHQGQGIQSGGAFTADGFFRLGHFVSETSNYNMSGGVLTLTGTAGGTENAGTLTIGVGGDGDFNQTGGTVTAQRLHLNSRNNTSGTDTYDLEGGTLALRSGGLTAAPSNYHVNLGGGTVQAAQSFTVAANVELTGTNGNVAFNTNSNSITVNGVMSGAGGFRKTNAGDLILNEANTFTGSVSVETGNVLTQNSLALGGTSEISVFSGGTLDTTGTFGYTFTKNVLIAGGGTVKGNILFNAGARLSPGNSVTPYATPAGGAVGTLTFTNDLTVNGPLTGAFQLGLSDMNIGHAMPAIIAVDPSQTGTSDLLNIGGMLTINNGGTLDIIAAADFAPMLGDVYDIADWISGSMGTTGGIALNLPTLGNGLSWDRSLFTQYGVLVVVPEPSRAFLIVLSLAAFVSRRRNRR